MVIFWRISLKCKGSDGTEKMKNDTAEEIEEMSISLYIIQDKILASWHSWLCVKYFQWQIININLLI